MSTIMDLSVLSAAGASEKLCNELMGLGCEVKASKEEAIVFGSDKSRLFRVSKGSVDQELLKSIFEKNASLQKWVGECRTTARQNHGDNSVKKDYDATGDLLAFRGDNEKVRITVVKRHENEKNKYEKHAAYLPSASVNGSLYRLCRIAMEQFKGPELEDKDNGPGMIQLAPEVRYNEKLKAHVPTPAKEQPKPWSDKIVYNEPKVEKFHPEHHHHHHHHKS